MLQDETLSQKLIKKSFWIYFFTIFIAPIGYLIRLFVSNNLSVEQVGVIYSVLGFITLFRIYHDFGLTESLNYFLPKFWIQKKYDSYKTIIFINLIFQLFTGFVIGFLLYLSADWFAKNYFHSDVSAEVLRIFCYFFFGMSIFHVLNTIFISFQDVFSYKFTEFLRMASILAFTVYFFYLGTGNISVYSWARVWGTYIYGLGCVYFFAKKYLHTLKLGKIQVDKKLFKTYFGYSLWVFLGANVGTILGQIDQQMVIFFLGPKEAGFYTTYLSLSSIYFLIVGPLMSLIFPVITELVTKQDDWKIKLFQNIMYKYFSVFAIAGGLFLFVLADEITTIFFGQKFIESGELLKYSSLFIIFNILLQINFSIMAGYGMVKERVKILALVCLINFLLNLFLIPKFGNVGAVISTLIGRFLMFVLSFQIINKKHTILIDYRFILLNSAFLLVAVFLIYYIKGFMFVFDDSFRYKNFLNLLLIGLFYAIYLLAINYKSIIALKNEIKKFKKLG